MIITYYGDQFVKISQGDTVIAINPLSKESGRTPSRFGSGLVLSTTAHPLYNGYESVTYGDTVPFVIDGPGEYEHSGVVVRGKGTTTTIDGNEYQTTVYTLTLEDITIGFLGPVSEAPSNTLLEIVGNTDILFVPIGGEGVLEPSAAYKLAVSLAPKIIIPMDYGKGRNKEALTMFLKEAGATSTEAIEKLTIRRKEIDQKDGDVIVLQEN
jgi:L-ascorbate metabolism protein UlaG (beta-lactamase superfamily)